MFILGIGRKAFLEFLRNLTPQILFFSVGFVGGSKLVIPSFDPSNAGQTIICFILLGIALCAAWANGSLFLSESITALNLRSGLPTPDKSVGPIQLMRTNWRFIWSKKWSLLEMIVVLVIVEFGFVAVTFTAIGAASSLVKNL